MILSDEQKTFFEQQGYLLVENAVSAEQLAALRKQFADWLEDSRGHDEAYGETVDGRARFDLEPGHSAEKPALRRINAPTDISEDYYRVMRDSRMTDCVAELIGPGIKYHHSKVNSKLPGAATAVKWHQDFPFTPHSNDDLITALLMVDEVTDENGPLQVVPGSHKGEIYDLWHDGVFTGAVDDEVTRYCLEHAVTCTGKAGSLCLMHTRLLHGSAPNLSSQPRTLFITVYSAEDAIPAGIFAVRRSTSRCRKCRRRPHSSISRPRPSGKILSRERNDRISMRSTSRSRGLIPRYSASVRTESSRVTVPG
jgi:ectoine hydroxylase-related dioxygenase (phytanoyl-CoA dioxygenase family)